MKNIKHSIILLLLSSVVTISCRNTASNLIDFNDYISITNESLKKALELKKKGLVNYLNSLQQLASNVTKDDFLISFFQAKDTYYQLKKDSVEIPTSFDIEINTLKDKINKHYLAHYIHFYDMLFINTDGDVFFTIRKEADYHANISDSIFINNSFKQKLIDSPLASFVDFQFYQATGSPSAFYIEPVIIKNQHKGWILMQLTVDKINNMFNDVSTMGQTGEIFLVNKEHYLLTDSRFRSGTTILKQKLPEENIHAKFQKKKGSKQVIDYRGKEVISVFEVFSFMNCDWLIIAKKDKNEVFKDFFQQHSSSIKPLIGDLVINQTSNATNIKNPYTSVPFLNSVFIDEYRRSDTQTMLFTQGISTCTALCATYKNQFSYMGHISPYDEIYGNTHSDIVQSILNDIEYFEIPDSKKETVCFYIVGKNMEAINQLIEKLTNQNYNLNQVKVAYNPSANYANVYCDKSNNIYIDWYMENSEVVSECMQSKHSIQDLLLSTLQNNY